MRSKVMWSFLSLVALASGGLMAGCDGDATIVKSGEGEACDRTADCADGLKCFQGACYASSGSGNEGGEGTGGSISGPPAPVLSSLGESCGRRADCEEDLRCFNQRCVEDVGAGGGGPVGGVELGGPGETCGLTSDCDDGLVCLPQASETTPAPVLLAGSNSIGVCTEVDTGLEPSGNTCGHECAEALDCCELPLLYHQPYDALTYTYGTGANSCAQLADLLAGVDCDAAAPTAIDAARCFAQQVFCQCAEDTWSCTGGSCVYEAACSITGLDAPAQPGGCPALSRTGRALVTSCNADTETCTLAATAGCTNDDSCEGEYVADSALTDICVADECTCYQETSQCYRACFDDLDCAAGRVCDLDTNVCVQAPGCTEDTECVVRSGDFRSQCLEGECVIPCTNDLDCNENGLTDGNLMAVCGDDNRCQPLGCTTNDECPAVGGVKTFCGAAPAVADGGVSSAITGGGGE